MELWKIGLLVFILGGILNTILINLEVGGTVRELVRISILVGLLLLIIGFMRRKK